MCNFQTFIIIRIRFGDFLFFFYEIHGLMLVNNKV